jgi:transcription elongation factor Elf1
MPKTKLPKTTKCPHCGHVMRIALWAYAHWNEHLIATCQDCGERYGVYQGKVTRKHP